MSSILSLRPLRLTLAVAAALPALASAQTTVADDEIARVVVTGSNIRVTQKEGASAVQVLTAKDLAATGKTAVADVLRAISANSGNSYNEQYTGSFSAGTAGLSLRGLGQKNTLILVNGKRVAPPLPLNARNTDWACANSTMRWLVWAKFC